MPDALSNDQHTLRPQGGHRRGRRERVDFDALRIGDVLLVRRLGLLNLLNPATHLMRWGQSWLNDLGPEHTRWSHVAIYVGEGRLVEAKFSLKRVVFRAIIDTLTLGIISQWPQPGGVRLSQLKSYYPTHELRFRRFKGSKNLAAETVHRPLGPVRRLRICVAALHQIGKPYGVNIIVEFINKAFEQVVRRFLDWIMRRSPEEEKSTQRTLRDAVICSTLYEDCFSLATEAHPAPNRKLLHMTPALISALDGLEDVQESRWVEVNDFEDDKPKLRWEDKDRQDAEVLAEALLKFNIDRAMHDNEACAAFLVAYLSKGHADRRPPDRTD